MTSARAQHQLRIELAAVELACCDDRFQGLTIEQLRPMRVRAGKLKKDLLHAVKSPAQEATIRLLLVDGRIGALRCNEGIVVVTASPSPEYEIKVPLLDVEEKDPSR